MFFEFAEKGAKDLSNIAKGLAAKFVDAGARGASNNCVIELQAKGYKLVKGRIRKMSATREWVHGVD
jgi:hypothetical protein